MIPLRDNVKSRTFPIVNYLIIAANIAAFVYQVRTVGQAAMEKLIFSYGVVPSLISNDWSSHYLSLITSQFLHGGLMHIIGNMVYLLIFGDNVEDKLGHFRYLFFYIICGSFAALAQVYFHPDSMIPMVGASGAIAGVLGAYFFFYPKAKVVTVIPLWFFIRIVEIPAFFFLGFWFLMQAFSGTSDLYMTRAIGHDTGGIAWWAHAGGFVSGFIMAILSKIL